jgi:casein kinase I family protein HRR25
VGWILYQITMHYQTNNEIDIYQSLAGGPGIPALYWFGTEGEYNAMVMERLGPSLEELFNRCNRKFSLTTVLMLSDQLVSITYSVFIYLLSILIRFTQISRLEYVHSHHFVHRNIKPSNFLIGIGGHRDDINIIDFGLAKRYRDKQSQLHIPWSTKHPLTGTAAFASINNHHGLQQSRRDDLESLAYMLIYFLRGSLPWYTANSIKKHGLRFTENTKVNAHNHLHNAHPKEFGIFLDYACALRFDETPNYKYLRKLFGDLLTHEGYKNDYVFDWHTINTSPNNAVANIESKTISHVQMKDSKALGKQRV